MPIFRLGGILFVCALCLKIELQKCAENFSVISLIQFAFGRLRNPRLRPVDCGEACFDLSFALQRMHLRRTHLSFLSNSQPHAATALLVVLNSFFPGMG